VFAESSESRAAMMTMMMTTERGGPAPSLPDPLQLGGHAENRACPPPAPHPSDQERQPHQQRAAESDKSNHHPIVDIVAGQLAAHLAFGTGSLGDHWFAPLGSSPTAGRASRAASHPRIGGDCTQEQFNCRLTLNYAGGRMVLAYGERRHGVADIAPTGGPAMKTIVSALIALSVLAGIAAPASALDARHFYEQQDRASH
jgi:hypothetical protein